MPTISLPLTSPVVLSGQRVQAMDEAAQLKDMSPAGFEAFRQKFDSMGLTEWIMDRLFSGGSKKQLLQDIARCYIASFPAGWAHLECTGETGKTAASRQNILAHLAPTAREQMLARPQLSASGAVLLEFPYTGLHLPLAVDCFGEGA